MKQAAVGFRVHSGWSALVTVALENGIPTVLSRERVHLVKTFIYKFRQPYHTAERMPIGEAAAILAGTRPPGEELGPRRPRSGPEGSEKQRHQRWPWPLLPAAPSEPPDL